MKTTDKFRQYTSFLSDAELKMRDSINRLGEDTGRKTLATVLKILALGTAITSVLYFINFLQKI